MSAALAGLLIDVLASEYFRRHNRIEGYSKEIFLSKMIRCHKTFVPFLRQKEAMTNNKKPSQTDSFNLSALISSNIRGLHLISIQQFVGENYAKKVRSGACDVFEIMQPPQQDTPEFERHAFHHLLFAQGCGIPIHKVKKLDDQYFWMDGTIVKRDHELVVFIKSKRKLL